MLPGTVPGAVPIQMVRSFLAVPRVDIQLHPLVRAVIIFAAVVLDGLRNAYLDRLRRRMIRLGGRKGGGVQKGTARGLRRTIRASPTP